jgi:hypothetical protein
MSEKLSFERSIKFLQNYWSELCNIRQQGKHGDPHGKLPMSDSPWLQENLDRMQRRIAGGVRRKKVG